MAFSGIEGESMIVHLDLKGIAASTGSACSSKSLEPSHVLLACGLSPEQARASVRFGIGKDNTAAEIDTAIAAIVPIVRQLRQQSPLYTPETP